MSIQVRVILPEVISQFSYPVAASIVAQGLLESMASWRDRQQTGDEEWPRWFHADLVQVLDKGPVTGPLHRDGVPPKGRRTSPETAIPTAEEGPAPGPASAVKPFAATLAAIDAAIARASSEEGRGSSSSHGPVFEQGAAPAADYSPVFEQDAVVTSDDDYVMLSLHPMQRSNRKRKQQLKVSTTGQRWLLEQIVEIGDQQRGAGALEGHQKRLWVERHIDADKLAMAALCTPICPQHQLHLKQDPQTGKLGRKCRKGPLCKKLHVRADAVDEIKTAAPQRFNLPSMSLCTLQSSPDKVVMYIRPPWRSALLPFYKFFLEQDVEEAPVAAISDIYIDGECYVRLIMKDQHKPTAEALSMDKLAPGSMFQYLDHADEMNTMRVSGIQQAPNQLYAHGTDVIHLKPIMATRRLLPGATCHPIGCYGFPATSENITAGYDVGAVVLAEFKGCLLDVSKCNNWFFEDCMPAGSVGCLRHDKRRKMYQFVCHPDGVEIKELRVKLDVLRALMNEALDSIGYSEHYHTLLKEMKAKHEGTDKGHLPVWNVAQKTTKASSPSTGA